MRLRQDEGRLPAGVGSASGSRQRKQAIGAKRHVVRRRQWRLSTSAGARIRAAVCRTEVGWFEEPVSSDDLPGLRAMRKRAPAGMEIAAGEYAYTVDYVRNMLQAQAVDVQQADVTRCGGITAFLQIAALCEAFHIDLSGHCAPALHLHVACAVAATATSGMVSRSCPYRAHAVRRRACCRRRCHSPRSLAARQRPDFQTPGRGALRRLGSRWKTRAITMF